MAMSPINANVALGNIMPGNMRLPTLEIAIEAPEILLPGANPRSRINAAQKKAVGNSLTHVMVQHHKKRIPQHFDRWKQKKYNFQNRSEETMEKKRAAAKSALLVRTGKTKERMKRRIDMTRPTTTANGMQVKGILKFKEGFRRPTNAVNGVTYDVMVEEIKAVTPMEAETMADEFTAEYDKQLSALLKPRQKKTLAKAGINIK